MATNAKDTIDDIEEEWWNNREDFGELEEEQETDVPDTAVQHVGNETQILMGHFAARRFQTEQPNERITEQVLIQPRTEGNVVVTREMRQLGDAILVIGDRLDLDVRLQNMIDRLPPDQPLENLRRVAEHIFSDRRFNWGRVVMLFYLAYKLMKRFVDNAPVMRSILGWVVNFVVHRLARSILRLGGWNSIHEFVGSTTTQALLVFSIGALSALAVYWKYQ